MDYDDRYNRGGGGGGGGYRSPSPGTSGNGADYYYMMPPPYGIPYPHIGGGGGGHYPVTAPVSPYATTPLTFQTTPLATTIAGASSSGVSPYPLPRGGGGVKRPAQYTTGGTSLHTGSRPPLPGGGAAAGGAIAAGAVSPAAAGVLVTTKKQNAPKLNTITVSPTKTSNDAQHTRKSKHKNKISKEDLKRAMNLPIASSSADDKKKMRHHHDHHRNKTTTRERTDARMKTNQEKHIRGRDTIKSKSRDDPYRDGSRRSKRKRNPEKILADDSKETRRMHEKYRNEYGSESEGDNDYEDDDDYDDDEVERRHDSRSRSRRRNSRDIPDDSFIDRRRDDSYRDRALRRSRSRRRSDQHRYHNDYEYDAVEVGLDDEPWYLQASDMIQDSCPALNCDGYAEQQPEAMNYDTRTSSRPNHYQGRQRFHERNNARRTDHFCGDEVVIPQWLIFAVGGMIGCCFIF